MLGEIEPLDSDEESDLSCEQHTGGVDGGDIYSTFSSALPQEEGGAAWVRVDTVPAIDRTLKGAGIMFRFGDQVGWCVGRVKRDIPHCIKGSLTWRLGTRMATLWIIALG
jgi:hypothetical protein